MKRQDVYICNVPFFILSFHLAALKKKYFLLNVYCVHKSLFLDPLSKCLKLVGASLWLVCPWLPLHSPAQGRLQH